MNKARSSVQQIMATIDDMVTDFLYYDRKEDVLLPRGVIEEAIKRGDVTVDEIVNEFADYLRKGLA